jgi:GMP synthase (glutamine-hydrolysing)
MNGQKALKQITLIKTGGTIPEIRQQYGDFEKWFADGLGVSSVQQVDVFRNQPLPSLEETSAVVISGSAAMVSHREDWSEATAQWLKQAVEAGLPVLGVCYGHQLLAHALGGKVGLNPNGRQIGTVLTKLLDSATNDPLLGHLPIEFSSQTSHSESVLELPPNAVRLATSPLDDNFAIRFSEQAWGVQYHPEFSGPIMSKYIKYRSEALREEGLDPDQLLAKVTETEQALSVLKKFAELVSV